jgi:hypothetical protein
VQRFIAACLLLCACGSDAPANVDAPTLPDAARDAPMQLPDAPETPDAAGVRVGALHELPLLPPWDPTRPFNHSTEASIAARNGHVVVASIHMHFASDTSFDVTGFHKRVGVVVSHDDGESFGNAIDPAMGDQTTDPIVRSAADGSFFLANWDTATVSAGTLAHSTDHGDTWPILVASISVGDHGTLAVDDAHQALYVLGCSKIGFDGTLLASCTGGTGYPGYADAQGAHFGAYLVSRWDGTGAPAQEGAQLPAGASADLYTKSCAAMGPTLDGGQWIVRGVRDSATQIVLRVRHPPTDEGADLPVTAPSQAVFFPAAAIDASGRLHVIWYDTSGPQGVLRYARSLSSDLGAGLGPSIVIDPNALPGNGWYPSFDSATGGRRTREYIELAAFGNRAHLAWTHAPAAPSRVYATYVEF